MAACRVRQNPGYRDNRLEIDCKNHLVLIDSQVVTLTRMEYKLLSTLASQAGRTIPRRALLERVWGYKNGTRTRTLDVHLSRVRKKLALAGRNYIETIFGVGARFHPWDSPEDAPREMADC